MSDDDLTERLRNPIWTFPEAEDISVLDSRAVRDMAEAADRIAELLRFKDIVEDREGEYFVASCWEEACWASWHRKRDGH